MRLGLAHYQRILHLEMNASRHASQINNFLASFSATHSAYYERSGVVIVLRLVFDDASSLDVVIELIELGPNVVLAIVGFECGGNGVTRKVLAQRVYKVGYSLVFGFGYAFSLRLTVASGSGLLCLSAQLNNGVVDVSVRVLVQDLRGRRRRLVDPQRDEKFELRTYGTLYEAKNNNLK